MLGRVEEDLDSMGPQEPEREGRPSCESGPPPRTQGLTGFSVALVSTLGRVVHLLRQVRPCCEAGGATQWVLIYSGLKPGMFF